MPVGLCFYLNRYNVRIMVTEDQNLKENHINFKVYEVVLHYRETSIP